MTSQTKWRRPGPPANKPQSAAAAAAAAAARVEPAGQPPLQQRACLTQSTRLLLRRPTRPMCSPEPQGGGTTSARRPSDPTELPNVVTSMPQPRSSWIRLARKYSINYCNAYYARLSAPYCRIAGHHLFPTARVTVKGDPPPPPHASQPPPDRGCIAPQSARSLAFSRPGNN